MNTMVHEDFANRCHKVLQVAKDLYQRNPDWVTFFREVLGVNGAARNVFSTQADYISFEKSDEHTKIQTMVASLRNRKIPGNGHNEPTRVITVRLPESLHEALKAEANDHNTSMNKLCISKLLQALADENQTPQIASRVAAATRPQVATPPPARGPVPAPSRPVPPQPLSRNVTPGMPPQPVPRPVPGQPPQAVPMNPPVPRPMPQGQQPPKRFGGQNY